MFVFGILFLIDFVSAVVPDDCDGSMVSYWQMEGDATDSFGSHDGTGFPGIGLNFAVGNSANFDRSQKISIGDSGAGTISGSFTIEFWVQKDPLSLSEPRFLFNKGGYQVNWTAGDEIRATVNSVMVSSGALAPGTSYHVVLTWHATKQELTLYVNSVVKDSELLVNKGSFLNLLEIGENFIGLVDEVALYNRSFSSDDVNSHYGLSSMGSDYCPIDNSPSTVLDIISEGCVLPNGDVIGEGSCSRSGMYYCGAGKITFNTLYNNTGCSFGVEGYTSGSPQCCPSGYLCGDNPSDSPDLGIVCNLRTVECSTRLSRGICDNVGCFWINEACTDIWNVGAAGMGTEVCGTSFIEGSEVYVIPQDSCGCDWTSTECVLEYDVVSNIVANLDEFRCQKDFISGDCVEGLQSVSWTALGNVISGWSGGVSNGVLVASGCENGGIDRVCGEPIVKLPGFSLFALMFSLGIIGLIYFWSWRL
jgi:hypothetical protein